MADISQQIIQDNLDVPFKEFTAGQIIQSKHFNDDIIDIEDKVNEIITKYNIVTNSYKGHIINYLNPHQVTASQTGAYSSNEVDTFIIDLRNGNFNDNSILNHVLSDGCVDNRNFKDGSITVSKVEALFGSQIDISQNISITDRYTKQETNTLIQSKVGDGTYDKATIDEKISQVQAGQIVDKTIGFEQLKDSVGRLINLSSNPSIINRYTKDEVDALIIRNGLPRDWGSIVDPVDGEGELKPTAYGFLPITGIMTCAEFAVTLNNVLDVKIKEVVESRNGHDSLSIRLNAIEGVLDGIINMFNEVIINE